MQEWNAVDFVRVAQGMTVSEFAKKTGIAKKAVRDYSKGKTPCLFDIIRTEVAFSTSRYDKTHNKDSAMI